jgi:hypothetical protein
MPNSIQQVVVLCWRTPGTSQDNARKIADYMGASVSVVPISAARDAQSAKRLVPACAALIISVETLSQMAEAMDAEVSWLPFLMDLAPHVFLYGFNSSDSNADILRTLTSDWLLGLDPLPNDATFAVAGGQRESCGQFSGLTFQGVDTASDASFKEGTLGGDHAVLIRAAGRPFLVRIGLDTSKVFLTAGRELADLGETIPHEAKLLPWFSRLIPLMIFLRSALGDRLWHSDCPQACFIIDDPLLKRRYGFLEYSKLLEAMKQQRFSASIAFIPWNYRRSRRQIADLFSQTPTSLSLCIHGCDHTWGEFADASFDLLCGKAQRALERMKSHLRLSGVPFDDVMVFPQGLFSGQALKALEASGYLAAINTDVCPSNLPKAVALRDLLDVAVTPGADLPLFGRQYPRDPAEFAFYLFLGKPAFVVEHHGYFRNGYEALRKFVERLNSLDERLVWKNPATVCSRAALKKITADGDIHVRFYTSRFQFVNSGTQTQSYVFSRRRIAGSPLPAVTVNGHPCLQEQKDGNLLVRLSLGPGEKAEIRILSDDLLAARAIGWRPPPVHNMKVFVRRILCEVRDNHLETNRLFEKLMRRARRLRARVKELCKGGGALAPT